MKVAIGFFGQPRFYSQLHSQAIRRLIDKYEMDVYCHAWWDALDPYILGARGHKYANEVDVVNGLQRLYDPIKLHVERDLRQFNEHGYTDDVFMEYGKDYRTGKRFPSSGEFMSAFVSQKRLYDMVEWDKYDWIIRWRYDLAPTAFPDLHTLTSDKMYAMINDGTEEGVEIFDDSGHIIPPQFRELWNLYEYLEPFTQLHSATETLIPEHVHLAHAKNLGIREHLVKLPKDQFYGLLVRNQGTIDAHQHKFV